MANVRAEQAPKVAAIRVPGSPVGLRPGGLQAVTPRGAFGPLVPGGRTVVLSKGAFGKADVVADILDQTGPADLTLATWTISAREIGAFRDRVASGQILSLRLMVDASFPARNAAYAAKLRASYGADCIRLAVCHAKLAVITNDAWAVVVLSSANLNRNSRLEIFSVEDNRVLADELNRVLGTWFEAPAADQWDVGMSEHGKRLASWGASADPARLAAPDTSRIPRPEKLIGRDGKERPVAEQVRKFRSCPSSAPTLAPATPGDAAFFNDDPFGVDLRRAGISFVR